MRFRGTSRGFKEILRMIELSENLQGGFGGATKRFQGVAKCFSRGLRMSSWEYQEAEWFNRGLRGLQRLFKLFRGMFQRISERCKGA